MLVLVLASLVCATSCDDDCVDVDASCTPLYDPTFDNVYTNTLSVSCSVGNGTCHTDDGQSVAGGLSFATADGAYGALTSGRVDPSDVGCSTLVYRIETDSSDVMPPGSPLPEAERCAIVQWVANGAKR